MKGLVLAVFVAALCALAVPFAVADPALTGYPDSMASTGDSITRAFNTCPSAFTDCPANSWSTGTSASVNSHYRRILAANPRSRDATTTTRRPAEDGRPRGPGAVPIAQHAEYVTILMGANDVCTSSESTMTPVATLRSQLQTALTTLSAGLPNARIFVASIPDVYHLWQLLHTNFAAVSDVVDRRHLPVAARAPDVDVVDGPGAPPPRAAALDRRQRRDQDFARGSSTAAPTAAPSSVPGSPPRTSRRVTTSIRRSRGRRSSRRSPGPRRSTSRTRSRRRRRPRRP